MTQNELQTERGNAVGAEPLLPMVLPIAFEPPTVGQRITSQRTGITYTIGRSIDHGNFGVVFHCRDDWDNELVAKVLKPQFGQDVLRQKAESEFQRLLYLRHPNITHVYEAFEFGNYFYIIMEYCNFSIGNLMSEEWFDGRFWVLPVARCLLQAVHFIHVAGMVHKDIHPGNVLTTLTRDELGGQQNKGISFRLADFGIAHVIGDTALETTTLAQWMLPPECIDPVEFGPVDHRIDIYHSGLLLLQILSKQNLQFTREEIIAGLPRQMALQLPSPYRHALEKALRRHVTARSETARELWRDLKSPP